VTQVVECLPSNCENLNSNPSTIKKKIHLLWEFFVIVSGGTAVWTQGFTLVGQALCHLSHSASSSIIFYVEMLASPFQLTWPIKLLTLSTQHHQLSFLGSRHLLGSSL
jgi:hypothetical protein